MRGSEAWRFGWGRDLTFTVNCKLCPLVVDVLVVFSLYRRFIVGKRWNGLASGLRNYSQKISQAKFSNADITRAVSAVYTSGILTMALQAWCCSRRVCPPASSTPSGIRLTYNLKATPKGESEGGWDSIHVFEAIDRARRAHYKLTSTVILHLGTSNDGLGHMDLSGNMTRQIEQDMPVTNESSHIVNVGRLVEDMELKMRNLLRTSFGCRKTTGLCANVEQRRFTSARRKML